ncbi:MAG: hypothetical protein JRI97_05920 [Deltaproteobacteria bacterium]|nr:hypothetical protein [Deltaproteobacteria bacterium]
MPDKDQTQSSRLLEDKGKIAWTLVALFLICMPLVAVGQLMVASDDELQEVSAQSIFHFDIEARSISVNGNAANNVYLDAAVLKFDADLVFQGVRVSRVALGYYNDGHAYDGHFNPDWDIMLSDGGDGVVFGGHGYFMNLNGVRVELAYDNLRSANPNFLFLRFGTDDCKGIFDFTPDGTTGTGVGSIERISLDGRIYGVVPGLSSLPMAVNTHRAWQFDPVSALVTTITPYTKDVWHQVYGSTGPNQGDRSTTTDFYFSLATKVWNMAGTQVVNDIRAVNPGATVNSHIPGEGWWIHFNDSMVNLNAEIW